MRNIKFRAKAVGSGRWLYGDLVWTGSQRTEPHIIEDWSADEDSATSVDERTLGMSVGISDVNMRMIFTGDILAFNGKVIGYITDESNSPRILLAKNNEKGEISEFIDNWYIGKLCCNKDDFKIVGNIFDNPDLMIRRKDNTLIQVKHHPVLDAI